MLELDGEKMPVAGPLPRFAKFHVRRALELLGEHKRIGRKKLAEELGLGEGSIRTLLSQLKRQGLIKSSRAGHELTAKGKRELGKPLEFVRLDAGPLTVGRVDVATVVRGAAKQVKLGIEQRDEAIKVGAEGATVLVFEGGRLRFPSDPGAEVNERVARELLSRLKPRASDVIIIGTASDEVTAERGARAAALSLVRKA